MRGSRGGAGRRADAERWEVDPSSQKGENARSIYIRFAKPMWDMKRWEWTRMGGVARPWALTTLIIFQSGSEKQIVYNRKR